jgi:hypothetical protein
MTATQLKPHGLATTYARVLIPVEFSPLTASQARLGHELSTMTCPR